MRKSRSTKRKRKQYSGAFKAQVALEALIGIRTTAQLARGLWLAYLLGNWLITKLKIRFGFQKLSDLGPFRC
jgi:transposase-like protein